VARRVLANQRRSERRRSALAERLISELDASATAPAAAVSDDRISRAFASLGEADREILALVAWEGLTHEELSVALGAGRGVVRLRLHRARRRFEAALERETQTAPVSRLRLSEGGEERECA
jgi:RNA polymerase sigma-70 factor (ECF subfamily)